jgi:hypothetical protein
MDMRGEGAWFVQSAGEFPLGVGLGRKGPSWKLKRWGRDTLGFYPVEDGGYSVRGDRRSLLYAGGKQSHRFTILDNGRFEYDIILNKAPESNRFCLAIEGWEGFDFFRQPDTFGPDMLRGSYAVYRKEGVVSSSAYRVGTGKLCHIHRPKIIDARGRRVWGDIRIDRGVLTLTVPEGWLADAAYPVTVDPVIGSTPVGAYSSYPYISAEYYQYYLDDKEEDPDTELDWYTEDYAVEFAPSFVFNKYTLPFPLNGTVAARVYVQSVPAPSRYYTPAYEVLPVVYGDSGDKPGPLLTQHSTAGNPIANISSAGSFTPRWVGSTLTPHGTITAGTGVWLGYWGETGTLRFDYGARLFQTEDAGVDLEALGEYDAFYDMAPDYALEDLSYCEDRFSDPDTMNVYPGNRYDMKVSMYLELLAVAYTRTLTQGVTLTDTRKPAGNYKRGAAETVRGTGGTKGFGGFYRGIVQSVTNTTSLKRLPTLIRNVAEAVAALYETNGGAGFNRSVMDAAGNTSVMHGMVTFFRTLFGQGRSGDTAGSFITRMRIVADTETVEDETGHAADYLRGLFIEAGSIAGTAHRGEYYRVQEDTAGSEGIPLRHLFVFIRLLTGAFIRDYITGRFLKSKEEIVLKSAVCREMRLESKIR